MIKKLIPSFIKLNYQLWKRSYNDHRSGFKSRIANSQDEHFITHHKITIKQPVKQNASAANKVHNIELGFSSFKNLVIQPDEYFSFWHYIPQPTAKNGYKKGRNLVNGVLKEDYGGGLCQLAGLIYMATLKSGLEIIERHNHTVDIYTDETRYIPLGSDASVVYGYKDLRFKNILSCPICFNLYYDDIKSEIAIELYSAKAIKEQNIQWNTIATKPLKIVETRTIDNKLLAISKYK